VEGAGFPNRLKRADGSVSGCRRSITQRGRSAGDGWLGRWSPVRAGFLPAGDDKGKPVNGILLRDLAEQVPLVELDHGSGENREDGVKGRKEGKGFRGHYPLTRMRPIVYMEKHFNSDSGSDLRSLVTEGVENMCAVGTRPF
jgi:hypothetical protein